MRKIAAVIAAVLVTAAAAAILVWAKPWDRSISATEVYSAYVEPVIVDKARAITEENVTEAVEAVEAAETVEKVLESVELPSYYDYRDEGRSTEVLDQGGYGTCWAFAALTALETSMMPGLDELFSRDHLNYHNSYDLGIDGGSYTISIAYLTAWQGPVYESDDPYGDGESPDGLDAVVHVQEVRLPADKDYETIKQTVFLYGGVETSLYLDITDGSEDSESFNEYYASYYYSGTIEPNHDVVIVGWDDDYPAENFQTEPEGDGAFICQNSWGTGFGYGGFFYVSYYDTNIGTHNAAYTCIEAADNYDYIYQTDLCGYTGELGYNTNTAYFANVYQAEDDIDIRAAGFYATGDDTEYEVAVITDYKDGTSLAGAEYVTSGYLQYAGYYTVALDGDFHVDEGESFAVVVKITAAESTYPIAVEYAWFDDEVTVDLTDGEGYVSDDGVTFENTEENHDSNVCLKVYADAG